MKIRTIGTAAKVFCIFFFTYFVEPSLTASTTCRTVEDTANCSYTHLSSVPTNLKADVKVLYLDGNSLQALKSNSFVALPALTNLSITHSKVSILDKDAFKGLRKLQTLDLSSNKIHTLTKFHADLGSLIVLHLEYNQIGKVPQDVFNSLTKLQELHLQHNKLTFIHPHAFTRLTAVTSITIDHNSLTAADDDWFRPVMKTLTHTFLDHNPWNCGKNMCDFKKWASKASKPLSSMLNLFCRDSNQTLKKVHTKSACRNITITVKSAETFSIPCPEGKATNWTLEGIPIHAGAKYEIKPGNLTVKGSKKHVAGHYCCRNLAKVNDSHCFLVKVSTSPTSSSNGGTVAAVVIIVIIAFVLFGVWYFKRKRLSYGVLSDEPAFGRSQSVPSGSTRRRDSQDVDDTEVGEAYV